MATIKVETNSHIPEERIRPLSVGLCKALAQLTGEPEPSFSAELAGNRRMRMAESDEPIAHVEIRGTEFPKDRAAELSAVVSALLDEHLSIHEEAVYIAVVSSRMSMWRVNGSDVKRA